MTQLINNNMHRKLSKKISSGLMKFGDKKMMNKLFILKRLGRFQARKQKKKLANMK